LTDSTSRSASPSSIDSITVYSIPFKIPGSQSDRQLLHYYCCQAAWNLSSYADPVLWTELILQRAYDQPVVRNSLVALSSLHKSFISDKPSQVSRPNASPSVETMAMVSKCYVQLRNYLARADASADVALICSLIFYALESFLGDTRQAISHLDSGLALLKRTGNDPNMMADSLFEQLTRLFQRLDVQASAYNDMRTPVLELVSALERSGSQDLVPDSFDELDAAEVTLTRLQSWTLHQIISTVEYKPKPVTELPLSVKRERVALRRQFDRYRHALTGLGLMVKSSLSNHTHTDKAVMQMARFLLLRTQFLVFYHLVAENVPKSLTDWCQSSEDSFPWSPDTAHADWEGGEDVLEEALGDLVQLLQLPKMSVVQSADGLYPSASPAQRTCTLSTLLVGSVYFFCIKTTWPRHLSLASQLLSHPLLKDSRDGLWDARHVESVVRHLMAVRSIHTAAEASLGHGMRLEDFALGLIDVEGGLEEAARRVAMMC
jgi:hypothetical protein